MVVEVLAAASYAAVFAAGWFFKGHSCREHVRRQQRQQETRVAVARRVRPELPAA